MSLRDDFTINQMTYKNSTLSLENFNLTINSLSDQVLIPTLCAWLKSLHLVLIA